MTVSEFSAAVPAGAQRRDESAIDQMVRVAFVVRLGSLAFGLVGFVNRELTPQTLVALLLLTATSIIALTTPRALDVLVRHPLIGMLDVGLVVGVFVVLGADSPLTLAALSTALLIGLLYPVHVSLLLGAVLALCYAVVAALKPVTTGGDTGEPGFVLVIGLPVTFLCLIWIGHAVVRIHRAQQVAERRLGELAGTTAAAEERTRLAREMHDSVAKSLQGIALGAAALPSWVDQDGTRARAEAEALADGARQAVQDARSLMSRMRADEPLRPIGEVLEGAITAWGGQHGHPVRVSLEAEAPVPTDVRYELLAAIREALENVRRHAPGAELTALLQRAGDEAVVTLADAGPGFDTTSLPAREAEGHFGVRGMHERLARVGGRARLDSRPGQGTVVRFWLPLAAAEPLPDLQRPRGRRRRDAPPVSAT